MRRPDDINNKINVRRQERKKEDIKLNEEGDQNVGFGQGYLSSYTCK